MMKILDQDTQTKDRFIVAFADGSEERFSTYSEAVDTWQEAGPGNAEIHDVDPKPVMSGALTIEGA